LPALPDLQRAFADAIYADNDAVARHVRDGRFPAARLLQVYRHNVFESLAGALKAVYPVVERLVGAGFFAYATDGYIRAYPPRRGSLLDFGDAIDDCMDAGGRATPGAVAEPRAAEQGCSGCGFGESFAEYLAGFAPAQGLPYLPDVARLEWAWHRAFHAADVPPLSLERLATVTPASYPALRFVLHPSVCLLASAYPLLRIWQVNQPDYAGDPSVSLAEGGVRLRVARTGLDVEIESLNAGDDALLRAFATGQDFDTASRAALAAQPDYDLSTALRTHVARGVITDFSIPGAVHERY
jgi:hypothetical protein